MHTPFRAAASDFLYAVCVVGSFVVVILLAFHGLTVLHAARACACVRIFAEPRRLRPFLSRASGVACGRDERAC